MLCNVILMHHNQGETDLLSVLLNVLSVSTLEHATLVCVVCECVCVSHVSDRHSATLWALRRRESRQMAVFSATAG